MSRIHKDMDEFFREQLHSDSDTGSYWDNPSDGVWENIALRIRDRKRRRFIWWIIPGLLAVTLFLAMMLINQSEIEDGVDLPVTQLDTHQEAIESTDSQAVISEPEALDAQMTNGETGIPTVDARTTFSGNITSNSRVARNTGGAAVDNADIPLQIATDQLFATEATDHRARMTGEASQEVEVVELEKLPAESVGVASNREKIGMTALRTVPEQLTWQREFVAPVAPFVTPVLANSPNHWALNGYVAPSWGTRRITVPGRLPDVRRRYLLQQETPTAQLGFGFGISYALGSRWDLSSGLEYSKYQMKTHTTHQVRFSRAGERLNDRGYLENTLDLNLGTSLGEVDAQVIVERSTGSQIDEHRFIGLDLQAVQTMQVIQVPLSLEYRIPMGAWSIGVAGGVSANIILKNTIRFETIRSLDSAILSARVSESVGVRGTKKITAGYHLGISLNRSLGEKWAAFVQPMYSGSFQSVYQGELIGVYPQLFDVHVGMKYYLQ